MGSIRFRIILLSTFALFFLGLSIYNEYDKVQADLKNTQKSLAIISTISQLSEIVHSLQRERGLSATIISPKKNEAINTTLVTQRQITDALLEENLDLSNTLHNNELVTLKQDLTAIRHKIDTDTASWEMIKQIYTEKIEHTLDHIQVAIESMNQAQEITHKLDAICDLAYARENLGLLRAAISRYYQNGAMTKAEWLEVSQRDFVFERRYKLFLLDQSHSNADKFNQRIETEVFYSVKKQIQSLLEQGEVGQTSTPVQWWSETTLVIDTMHEVENTLLNQIRAHAESSISKNEQHLLIYTLSAITAFVIVALLTIMTVMRILKALSILIYSLKKIERTENFGIRIETNSDDEFGQLSYSINNLLDYTDKIIQEKEELASLDVLTGIMNRRSFMLAANKEIAKSHRYERSLALLFCDIDRFKSINDHYGHRAGDEVLRVFAQTIQSHIAKNHLFARWGGEEFVILLNETTESEAAHFAEHLRQLVMAIQVEAIQQVTCSFGVAVLKKQETFDQLCDRADQAVYQAKNAGRNQVCIHKQP